MSTEVTPTFEIVLSCATVLAQIVLAVLLILQKKTNEETHQLVRKISNRSLLKHVSTSKDDTEGGNKSTVDVTAISR